MVYRNIQEGDNLNKGRYAGCCNRRDCMQEHEQYGNPIVYYNFGTGSFYCHKCAIALNAANSNKEENIKYCGNHPMTQPLTPLEVIDLDKNYKQPLKDLVSEEDLSYWEQRSEQNSS